MLTINKIKEMTNAKLVNTGNVDTSTQIENIDFDTRRLNGGSMYVPMTIGNTDGHLYIEEAVKKGANVILLSNKDYINNDSNEIIYLLVEDTLKAFQELAKKYREELKKPVIGITGSNGKTTSKDLISHLLSYKLKVHKTEGNFNNHLGVPLTILRANDDIDVMIVEMGMNHAGELDLLGSIAKPDYGVITNIGESHIEYLGSREGIAHAKGEMLTHLPQEGIAFIPYDCEFKDLLENKTKAKKHFFGLNAEDNDEATLAHDLRTTDQGTLFEVENDTFRIPLFGEHNVLNALPAISLARELGFTEEEIKEGLKDAKISPMRFELVSGKNDSLIINDAYNSSPTSMKKSCETFLEIFKEKKCIVVLGDMFELGGQDEEMHRSVGKALNRLERKPDLLITVGNSSKFISDEFDGIKKHFDNKDKVVDLVNEHLNENTSILFKASRGMKLETIIGKIKNT